MRKSYLLLAGAGAMVLAACSSDKKTSMNDDLKKDLELASSSDGITLANSSPNAGQQIVSAIERTTPPSRQQTPSNRVRKHKPAPKALPQVAQAQARATVTQIEEQSVSPLPAAMDPIPVSPRPRPVAVSYPSGPSSGGDDGSVNGGGSTAGAVIGSILGAVIRGGTVGDVDRCDPRTDGRRGTVISINQRFPYPVPGRGRIGSSRSSGPSIGGIPISRIPRF